jgi:hypothetical protein
MYFKLSSHLGEGLGVVVETVEADGNDVINPYLMQSKEDYL